MTFTDRMCLAGIPRKKGLRNSKESASLVGRPQMDVNNLIDSMVLIEQALTGHCGISSARIFCKGQIGGNLDDAQNDIQHVRLW